MKRKLLLIFTIILIPVLFTTGCKDEFADINTDPSVVSKPNVPYLFTQALYNFEPSDYLLWFYSGKYTAQWCQAFVPGGGYKDKFNIMDANGGIGSQFVTVLNVKREIDNYVSSLSQEEAAKYKTIQAMIQPLCIYLGIFDSDMYGSRPYSEACKARYGGTLTPKYDTIEELYTEWIAELNDAIQVLSTDMKDQLSLSNQDFVYNGNKSKWLKFANAVKLKIAVRLVHQNKEKAFQLAKEVASNDQYIMSSTSDDFVYNKGSQDYHFGNSASLGIASKNVMDFMMRNKDPRLRFMFTKNDFNSEVVQAFFDQEALKNTAGQEVTFNIPQYILNNVEYSIDAKGKKTFVKWKGMGEPWVRFYGVPVEMDAADKEEYRNQNNYFNSSRLQLTVGESTKGYTPYSTFNQEMIRGQIDFTYPTKPGGVVKQDLEDVPWYGMAISTAETNLYLAEMKMLGADLPKTAKEYYENAIKASVKAYDRLAKLNKIPYYDEEHCYDPNEKPLMLQSEEIEGLIENADYQLTGTNAQKLEKIYLQEYLHLMYQPIDQFVAVRRSGIPKVQSSLIPWVNLLPNTVIPRRFGVYEPNETDLMYKVTKEAYEKQGFTTGVNNSTVLNSERVWIDKNAPNFGEGPNIGL
jgi:hypothetical protein